MPLEISSRIPSAIFCGVFGTRISGEITVEIVQRMPEYFPAGSLKKISKNRKISGNKSLVDF